MARKVSSFNVALGKAPMALRVLKKKDRVIVEQDETAGSLHGPWSGSSHTHSRRGVVKTLLINLDQKHL